LGFGQDGMVASVRVVVVGAGIAGLAAAYQLRRHAPAGSSVLVLEGAGQIGGKLRVGTVGDLPVDEGAETFLARAPEAVGLIDAVGLGDQLTAPRTSQAAVVVGGVPRRLPTDTLLGVPADPGALRGSGVLSTAGLAAAEAEPGRPPEPLAPDEDVAVGGYIGRRLGRELVDRLVDPLLGGVYAGRADLLSLRATMPELATRLAEPVSVTAAARATLADSAGGTGPVFASLRGGLGTLPAAVARAAGVEVRLGQPVRLIERGRDGFRLTIGPVARPEYVDADAVVVAVPAAKAAVMLQPVAPAAAAELAGIEYASIAIITLAYPATTATRLAGSGLLVPATEGRAVKAVTFSSAKWAHLDPTSSAEGGGGLAVLRASVGRYQDERLLHRDDDDLAALVTAEVAALTGLAARPVRSRVTRWGGALPQYAVGHLGRVRRIEAAVAAVPGLAVCGAAYGGVGIPACIRSGYAAAGQVLAQLPAAALR
jgi:protoporphyrinogen/coproporphyrinogen III oxidase